MAGISASHMKFEMPFKSVKRALPRQSLGSLEVLTSTLINYLFQLRTLTKPILILMKSYFGTFCK